MPKLLYFLRTSTCFAEQDLQKQYDDMLKKAPSKSTNMCFTDTLFTQSVLLSSKSGLGVSSAQLLAFLAFVDSAIGAREALEHHFGEVFEDKRSIVLWKWFAVTGKLEAPENEHQKN